MIKIPTLLLATAAALCSPNTWADCDYDDFPRMDGMTVSSLGGNVQWNHMALAGRSFRVAASLDSVKQFYGRKWEGAVDYTEFNGWEQILYIDKHCMMMVQVKAQNERYSYGQMLLTNPPASDVGSQALGSGMPLPPEAQVISDMQSDDDIRQGRMVLLLNEEGMHATRVWYEAELQHQGWQLEDRSIHPNSVVLSYAKGRELMTVGLLRHQDKTQVLLNRMDR
jgi:hypothetical protein